MTDDPSEAATARFARADVTQGDPVSDLRREAEEGLAPGTLVAGRYVLRSELGRGGMGIVYKADDRRLGRVVALKVLRAGLLLDGDHLDRFEAEAKVTARLQHPAIVPVYDAGEAEDGRFYYTMKVVEGRSLVDLAELGWREDPTGPDRWSLSRALGVVVQVCRAVAYAHGQGLAHRDLKPSNVMVGRYGEVHVLDWGLAKAFGAAPAGAAPTGAAPEASGAPGASGASGAAASSTLRALTEAGSIVGTPAYMAPEQAAGEPLDARADVYALGGVLYTVLSGHLPHEGTTSEVLWRLSRGVAPPPPSAHRRDVPPGLDAVVLRAMAADPAARTPSAEDLADAVEGWLEGRTPLSAVRAQDAAAVRGYRPSEFRRPSLTVDVALVHAAPGAPPRVFLQRRAKAPFLGCWALPGAFVRMEERLEDAARRVLRDEAGVEDPGLALAQVGAFGDPERDPRTRVVTVAHLAVVATRPDAASPPEQADLTGWFGVVADGPHAVRLVPEGGGGAPAELAFDHGRILAEVLRRVG